jgi:anti-sigma B factor antagonist
MVSMKLTTRESGGRAVVVLRGELDVAEAASVAAALAAVAARAPQVVVDLAGLAFIDSSGVAALVLARVQARRSRPVAVPVP